MLFNEALDKRIADLDLIDSLLSLVFFSFPRSRDSRALIELLFYKSFYKLFHDKCFYYDASATCILQESIQSSFQRTECLQVWR